MTEGRGYSWRQPMPHVLSFGKVTVETYSLMLDLWRKKGRGDSWTGMAESPGPEGDFSSELEWMGL